MLTDFARGTPIAFGRTETQRPGGAAQVQESRSGGLKPTLDIAVMIAFVGRSRSLAMDTEL